VTKERSNQCLAYRTNTCVASVIVLFCKRKHPLSISNQEGAVKLRTDVTQAIDSLTLCVERILRHQAKSMTKSYSRDFFMDFHHLLRHSATNDESPKKSPQYDEGLA
jgi:uncharacterized membrane-anchored protein YjiN (DUF445 family)